MFYTGLLIYKLLYFVPCKDCLGYFCTDTLWKHKRKCTKATTCRAARVGGGEATPFSPPLRQLHPCLKYSYITIFNLVLFYPNSGKNILPGASPNKGWKSGDDCTRVADFHGKLRTANQQACRIRFRWCKRHGGERRRCKCQSSLPSFKDKGQ